MSARNIRVDRDGNIYVCGVLSPPVQIQGVALASVTHREAFAAKFDSAGRLLWVREGGGITDGSWAVGVGIDSQTNVLISGQVEGTNLFGYSFTTAPFTPGQPYLLKLNPDGSNVWLNVVGVAPSFYQPQDSQAMDLAVDSSDNAIVPGCFWGAAQFGGINVAGVGVNNLFVASCNPLGEFQWAIRDGGTNTSTQPPYDIATSVALVGSRRIIMAGLAPTNGSFGSIAFDEPPRWEMFVAALDFPPPQLSIASANYNLTLAWPASPGGYLLETTTNLSVPSVAWSTNVGPLSQDVQGGTNYVTLPVDTGSRFFRLRAAQ